VPLAVRWAPKSSRGVRNSDYVGRLGALTGTIASWAANDRPSTLFPMRISARGPGAVLILAALIAGLGTLATPTSVRAWTTGGYSTTDEDLMLQLINNARASAGLKPVVMDSRLRSIAETRSSDFVRNRYFGHNIPTACGQVFSMLQQQGIAYSWAAENIGWNTYSDTSATQWQFDWFMGSATHKANILSASATSIGVGAYKDGWTYGSACGQTGTGATYTSARLYTIVFIQTPPPDPTPPTVTAPSSKLYLTTAGTTTESVRTSWSRSDASGIASSTLQRQMNGGTFATVISSATTTSVDQALSDGSTYRYRAQATDTLGNVSGYLYGPTFKPSRVEQSSTAVTYGGTWTSVSNTSASGGSYKYANGAGAWASFTFTGMSVGLMMVKSTAGGSAYVYVDGTLRTTISLYASATAWHQVVYAINYASQGTHTIKVVVKGTGRIYLDGFIRLTV
jgi:uncharacterized protein YkwD